MFSKVDSCVGHTLAQQIRRSVAFTKDTKTGDVRSKDEDEKIVEIVTIRFG